MQELLAAGRQMNIDIAKTRQGQGASQVIYSARAASKSLRQASSPHLGMPREKSVNSAQQKEMQIQAYDPIVAGKRAVYYVEDQRVEIPQPNQEARHHQQAQVYIVRGAVPRPAAQSHQQGGNYYAEPG